MKLEVDVSGHVSVFFRREFVLWSWSAGYTSRQVDETSDMKQQSMNVQLHHEF